MCLSALDSEDRLVATTETPRAMVWRVRVLGKAVVTVATSIGAFLDWGLAKDLLLPFSEQKIHVRRGHWVTVAVFLDPESGRIVASTRLNWALESRSAPRIRRGSACKSSRHRQNTPQGTTRSWRTPTRGLLFDHGNQSLDRSPSRRQIAGVRPQGSHGRQDRPES